MLFKIESIHVIIVMQAKIHHLPHWIPPSGYAPPAGHSTLRHLEIRLSESDGEVRVVYRRLHTFSCSHIAVDLHSPVRRVAAAPPSEHRGEVRECAWGLVVSITCTVKCQRGAGLQASAPNTLLSKNSEPKRCRLHDGVQGKSCSWRLERRPTMNIHR